MLDILETRIVHQDPPILNAKFSPIPENLVTSIWDPSNFEGQKFGELYVDDRRQYLKRDLKISDEVSQIKSIMFRNLLDISKQLLDCDKLRWPIFDIEFDIWFNQKFNNGKSGGINILPIIDTPGFHQSFHLDNRFVVLSGIINVQDNELATVFSNNDKDWQTLGHDQEGIIYNASPKAWDGTFWINTERNWHAVPQITTVRKILLINLFL